MGEPRRCQSGKRPALTIEARLHLCEDQMHVSISWSLHNVYRYIPVKYAVADIWMFPHRSRQVRVYVAVRRLRVLSDRSTGVDTRKAHVPYLL